MGQFTKIFNVLGMILGWIVIGGAAIGLFALGLFVIWGSFNKYADPVWRYEPVVATVDHTTSYGMPVRCISVGSYTGGYGGACFEHIATVNYKYTIDDKQYDGAFKKSFKWRDGEDEGIPPDFAETYKDGANLDIFYDPKNPEISSLSKRLNFVGLVIVPLIGVAWVSVLPYIIFKILLKK